MSNNKGLKHSFTQNPNTTRDLILNGIIVLGLTLIVDLVFFGNIQVFTSIGIVWLTVRANTAIDVFLENINRKHSDVGHSFKCFSTFISMYYIIEMTIGFRNFLDFTMQMINAK